ncbi:MAG: pyrroline-5-carboxylate reductase [Steroidobacteraceae bacterium]
MSGQHIAFIGGGHMGRALIGGLLARGASPADLSVADPHAPTRAALHADFGVRALADNAEAAAMADILVLAVKPQAMAAVLRPLAPVLSQRMPLVISIAAGVRLASLVAWCDAKVAVVRAMPNRPALCGAGITGLHAPPDTPADARQRAESVLAAVGETVWVEREADLDVVTALSGSGPAYFFLLAEQLAASGTRLGLDPATAHRLAVATLHGAGRLAFEGEGDLARLRAEVTSKGGTTEAALRSLELAQFGDMVAAAVDAAVKRGRELAEVA